MIPLDGKNLALITGTASAILAGIYIIWGPSERRKQSRSHRVMCPGLVNLGNTCFLNAVLQAVAPCASVCQWLELLTLTKRSSMHYLATTLNSVIKVLNNDSVEFTEEYCPSDVIRTLQMRGWVISSEEQDAHEMFHVLTETLNEETSQCPSVLSLFDIKSLEESSVLSEKEAVNRTQTNLPLLSKTSADHPFHGLLASQLCCKRCGHKCSVKYDTFDSLSLGLPSQYSGRLTLEILLKHYVMLESVDGVACDKCSHSEKASPTLSSFVKKLTIGKLPLCLCLHIQRTVWLNNGLPIKRFDTVSFPELLNMGPYIYQKESPVLRPKTLELDGNARLVGGRKRLTEETKPLSHKSPTMTSPTMSVPYSGPVNMLKALNYHSRLAQNGLYGVRTATNDSTSRQVQRLAQAYSAEALTCSEQQAGAYKLTSVIVHLGDISSGHFITYRRAPSINGQRFPDQWLYTSDVIVKKVPLSEVLAADAYMLFYEKI